MSYQDILGMAKTFQAVALLDENVRLTKKKKRKAKDFLRTGAINVIGTELLKQ